jgi:fusaric acid resistance family protein
MSDDAGRHDTWLTRATSRAWSRLTADAWPLLQGTLAATVAWLIATKLLSHPQPFFAPISAVIALNTSRGERGIQAVRLLAGVIVGIVVGELVLAVLGTGYGSLASAVFVAMAVARLLGGARIVLAQAAVGAILVISSGNVEIGPQRLLDALIGAGVALLFSQVLFTPEPVRLVRRAESLAVGDMASGLQLQAQALERDDGEMADTALNRLRDLRDRLSDLARMREASARVARRTLPWRSRRDPVVRANENAGQLDLLGGSCLMLARAAGGLGSDARRRIAPCVRELAGVLRDLSADLGDQTTRQSAADRALDVARGLSRDEPSALSPFAEAVVAARMVTTDVMVFAGVDPKQAVDAVREGTGEFHVPSPVQPARMPFAGEH